MDFALDLKAHILLIIMCDYKCTLMLLEKASKIPAFFELNCRLTDPSIVNVRPSCLKSAEVSTTTTPAIISCG